jgi:hypothetical protein
LALGLIGTAVNTAVPFAFYGTGVSELSEWPLGAQIDVVQHRKKKCLDCQLRKPHFKNT